MRRLTPLLLILIIALLMVDIGLRLRPLPNLAPTTTPLVTYPADATAQPQTIEVAFQCYERGAMIWRSDNGTIYVLAGWADGAVYVYQGGSYADLPEARGRPPQPDLLLPASGFGKLWAAHTAVRSTLGWATRLEQAYDALVTPYATRLIIGLPGLGAYDISYRGYFQFSAGSAPAVCG